MARTVTLLQLRNRVRQRADMENSTFVTDVELNDNLNESLAELYDLLVAAYGPEYFRSSYDVSTTSGADEYALPSDFYKLISVDIDLGGLQIISAKPYMEFERNRYKFLPMWNYATPVFYRLRGANDTYPYGSLGFVPTPSGAFSVTLNYVPTLARLFEDYATFDGIAGWEEYAVVDAAIKCLQKEESDVALLLAQKEALRQRIMAMAPSRDAGSPERVTDVDAGDGWWPWL